MFVVIFAMLLITVITVSFLRLMIADQNQATDSDLSQSAYDSAQAGVEDAKRALLRYQQVCILDPGACSALADTISSDTCNAAVWEGGVVPSGDFSGGSGGEVRIQQSIDGSDAVLDQAYTCVKVTLETEDYEGTLGPGQSQIVPLVVEDGQNFDTVTVRWFSREDFSSTTGAVDLPTVTSTQPLPEQTETNWPSNRPSVLRAQLMQHGDSFQLTDFDIVNSSSESNANTLFLYPTQSAKGRTSGAFVGTDLRANNANDSPDKADTANTPYPVRCSATVASGGYACQMSLTLPTPIGGGDRTAFLRLTPLYNEARFQVVLSQGTPLSGGSNIVKFKDVQPIIDSTGRANDLFRRVQSRVNLYDTSFSYPDATIEVTNNLCKDFAVTDSQYIAGACTP